MPYNIGETLRKYRNESKMTVKQISEILLEKGFKASEKTIYSWESGNSSPSPDALLAMCRAYGINDVLSAFGYNGYNEDGSIQLNIHEIDLIEKYRNLDDYGKKAVDNILNQENLRCSEVKLWLKNDSISIYKKGNLSPEQEKRLMAYWNHLQTYQTSLNAAHSDEESTQEDRNAGDAIMEDDSEWE